MNSAGPPARFPEDEDFQLARLQQFFSALGPLSFSFGALYAIGAWVVKSRTLGINAPVALGLSAVVALAQGLAMRRRLMASASTVGYAMLAVVVANVFIQPLIYPALVLVCIMAVAVVLPYLKGRALRTFITVTLGTVVVAAVKGVLYPSPLFPEAELPHSLGAFISVSTISAAAYLTLLLMWQFSSRLRLALDQTLESNAALAEARRCEQEAREAAEKDYRHLAAAIPQQVWTAMPDGHLEFVNRRAPDYFALSEATLLAEGFRSVIHPEDRDAWFEQWQRALASGENLEVEFRLRRRDGSWRWHLGRAVVMCDPGGQIVKWFGTNTEIHEQKETQKALRASEERFRSLTVATTQIVWTADPDGSMREDSPSWRAFTGQSYEQWLGEGWLDAVHPEDVERAQRRWREAVAHQSFLEMEYRVRQRDGGYAHMVARATPVRNEDGSIREWVGTNTDITEHKRAEERLREESRAFQESEERAREADRQKDEFLAMLGHELRNPLSPIVGMLDLLRVRHQGELGQELSVIDRQVRHVTRLVDDLLDVSRISRGKIQLKREPVELAGAVDRALEIAQPLIEKRGHQITLRIQRQGLQVWGDMVRLAQVIANLLTNAAKYTDPGGRILVMARADGDAVEVRVRDNGSGIPDALLPHLFELFVQGDRSLDRSQGGLGIGLTLVKRLVEMHGGSVSVHSEGPGRGSEFTLRLPRLINGPLTAAPHSVSELSAHGELCRILVVDDNVDAAEVLAECLQLSGHEVRVANDGPLALILAKEFIPEVVLLDIGLPSMDGFEVARRLRKQQGASLLRLIALTGYGQESDRQKARAAGFDDHLVKPVELEVLTSTIARLTPGRAQAAVR